MRSGRRDAGARGRSAAQSVAALVAAACRGGTAGAPRRPALRPLRPAPITVFVVSEAVDKVALIKFGPSGRTSSASTTGMMPTDPDGPHGVAVSPDGKHYFVSTAHGTPYGHLEVQHGTERRRGRRELGNLSGDGAGDARRLLRVRRELQPARRDGAVVRVGRGDGRDGGDRAHRRPASMPHGSRLNADGHAALFGVHDGRHARSRSTRGRSMCRGTSC